MGGLVGVDRMNRINRFGGLGLGRHDEQDQQVLGGLWIEADRMNRIWGVCGLRQTG